MRSLEHRKVNCDGSAAERRGRDGGGDVVWTHGAGLLQSSLKLLQLLLGLLVLAALPLQLVLHLVEQRHHVVLLLVLGLALTLLLLKALLQVLLVWSETINSSKSSHCLKPTDEKIFYEVRLDYSGLAPMLMSMLMSMLMQQVTEQQPTTSTYKGREVYCKG